MTKYNLDKLIKVECSDFCKSRWYTYKKSKKFLRMTFQKEGIYWDMWDKYIGLEPPKNHTVKDGIIYENPKVILRFQDDYSVVCYFDSIDGAINHADRITSSGKWINSNNQTSHD